MADQRTLVQLVPELESGGVERGTVEVAGHAVGEGWRSIVISGGGRLVSRVESSGARHLQLSIGKKSPWTLAHIPRLKNWFMRWASEGGVVVHARSRVPAWVGLMAQRGVRRRVPVRFVTTVHGFNSVNSYSRVMTRGDRVICVSDSIRSYLLESYRGLSPEKLVVIPRGVDDREFPRGYQPESTWRAEWEKEFPQFKDKRLIVLPGRITRLKGHLDFIRMLGELCTRWPDLHGLIVGDASPRHGPYVEELRSLLKQLGLEKRVTMIGYRPDVREVFSSARLVLNLSTKPESFGRTVLEALALGVPAAGYDRGGTGEVLAAMFPQGRLKTGSALLLANQVDELLQNERAQPRANCFPKSKWLESEFALYRRIITSPIPVADDEN